MNSPNERELLDLFFNPKSVAVIGLSRSAIGNPVSILTSLNDLNYEGEIFVVNPKMGHAPNATVVRDLFDIPKEVDLAVISVQREVVPKTLESCAIKGIKAAIIITQGFSDSDEIGLILQKEIDLIILKTGIRVLGPNTIGSVSASSGFTSSFIEVSPSKTPIGQVAQSGFLMMGHHIINNEKSGYFCSIDLGNSCDIGFIDVLKYYRALPHIKVIECHAESISEGRDFVSLAAQIVVEKPIVLLKAGKSEAGKAAVVSHTGAVAGQTKICEAALLQAGVILADSSEELRIISKTLATLNGMQGKRIGIISFSGGGAVLAIDAIEKFGLNIANLSKQTIAKIQPLFPKWMEVKNPLDVWIPVARDLDDAFPLLLETLLSDSNVDAVICIYCSYSMPKYSSYNSAKHISKISSKYKNKPVACWSYGHDIEGFTRKIEEEGLAIVYPSLDLAAKCLSIVAKSSNNDVNMPTDVSPILIDKLKLNKARKIIRVAQSNGRNYLFPEAFRVLELYDFNLVKWVEISPDEDIVYATSKLSSPLCLKINSPDLVHKTAGGGVMLGVGTENLKSSCKNLLAKFDAQFSIQKGVSIVVQEMKDQSFELMMGMVRDPSFGPCVVFGSGGVNTEILDDFSYRVAPLSLETTVEMIQETKISKILKNRLEDFDVILNNISNALMQMSLIALNHPEINEIDLNPIFLNNDELIVVDVRFILNKEFNK
ncbi:MAG: hypothetical protein CMJ13_08190 [Pelagibacterales bacterium]|nr:hypothetical protein [Pelagibacterales bacterium]